MCESVWTGTAKLPEFEALQGDARTDVLIIGGGLCGVLCAYWLKRAGVDCLLVEGKRIADGATKNTTAKITSQHGLIYDKMLRSMGRERTALYLEAQERALEKYRELAGMLDCGFEEKNAFVYSTQDRRKIEDEVRAVNSLGLAAEFAEKIPLPIAIEGAVRFPHQAQFHPLKFLAGITKGLPIYEHTFVEKVKGDTAITSRGNIRADKIIVASHFPLINRHGSYFLKLYQHRSYVLALEQAAQVEGMYVDEARDGLSFRNCEDLLLLGGGSHRTGKNGGGWRRLEEFAAQAYPHARVKYRWAAQDCMSLDGIPYIGRYSAATPNLYVATGFCKWGMTSSMAAALLLCDLVQEKENAWSQVFSPSRSMIKSQLFLNVLESGVHLLTPSLRRCSHMGCALKWNPRERTWDCPCHGSRFEREGAVIDNPAKKDRKWE